MRTLGSNPHALFEDLNDYGAVYSYDIDRDMFVHDKMPPIL